MSRPHAADAFIPAAAAVLLLAGCSSAAAARSPTPTPTPLPITVVGSVSVPNNSAYLGDHPTEGDPCHGKAGYDDIKAGAQVVVTSENGKTLGVGALDDGVLVAGTGGSAIDARCKYTFTVDDVPRGGKFYGVHVGNSNRGTIQFTADTIFSPDLTIG